MQLAHFPHVKSYQYPSRAEIFRAWNYAKQAGDIPKSWSFRRHGSIEKVWCGYILVAS